MAEHMYPDTKELSPLRQLARIGGNTIRLVAISSSVKLGMAASVILVGTSVGPEPVDLEWQKAPVTSPADNTLRVEVTEQVPVVIPSRK